MKIAVALLLTLLVVAGCGGAQEANLTPDQIVQAFQDAGLEAVSPGAMTAADYGLAPYVGQGVRFIIPSLCEDCGGRVFVGTKAEIDQLAAFTTRALCIRRKFLTTAARFCWSGLRYLPCWRDRSSFFQTSP